MSKPGFPVIIGGGTTTLFAEFPAPVAPAPPKPKAPNAKERAAKLSHDELTKLGARWLRNNGYVTFRESGATMGNERADVIGWKASGSSILIECKTSRADFFNDLKKECRRFDEAGFGVFRYYLCPAGLLKPSEVPEKWGLLYAYESKITRPKSSEIFDPIKAAIAEKPLLTALLNRLDIELRLAFERHGETLPTRHL